MARRPRLAGLFVASAVLVAAYGWCALRLVPPMEDHDWDFQSSAYGLIYSGKPLTVTDRGVLYSFCDPPFLSFQIGLVALARGTLDGLAYHYQAAVALREREGVFPSEASWRAAAEQSKDRFFESPHLPESRLPNLLLAAACLPLFFLVLERLTGSAMLAVVGSLVFWTLPETVVRFSSGSHVPLAIFCALLMVQGALRHNPRLLWWASAFGAFAKGKQLVVVPLAIAVWAGLQSRSASWPQRLRTMATHPAALGWVAGTSLLVAYGLWVHPAAFWRDYLMTHGVHRLLHIGTSQEYPEILGLWRQFHQVHGALFLPLAMIGTTWWLRRSWQDRRAEGAIALWVVVGAVIFSLIDWRQTKHLMTIVPAMVMAIMSWTSSQRGWRRRLLLGALALLITHNLWRLAASGGDLLSLHPTGDW